MKAHNLSQKQVLELTDESLIFNYLVMRVNFTFPDSTMFPSIPCSVDEDTTVYPLRGDATITGIEYLLARNQGATIIIHEAFMTPFAKHRYSPFKGKALIWEDIENGLNVDKSVTARKVIDMEPEILQPFLGIIEHIQEQRRNFPKGSFNNLVYKEIGNSIYGNIVRGINDKRYVDVKTGLSERISATKLSNPIMAS